jgi:hypothetical protein
MAKVKGPSIREFQKRFPDEDTCLNHLMRPRFGDRLTCFKCQKQVVRVRALRLSLQEDINYLVGASTRLGRKDWINILA